MTGNVDVINAPTERKASKTVTVSPDIFSSNYEGRLRPLAEPETQLGLAPSVVYKDSEAISKTIDA